MNIRTSRRLLAFMISVGFCIGSAPAFANTVCANNVTIKQIHAGWVVAKQGPDGGNSVMVSYIDSNNRTGELMLNHSYNLNDSPGPSLLSLLMLAQTTGQRVTLVDHHGTPCDDFDEVRLMGY